MHLSPHLGKRMVAGRLEKQSVFIRELLPKDLKVEIEQLTVSNAMKAASFLAGVVGKAHARHGCINAYQLVQGIGTQSL